MKTYAFMLKLSLMKKQKSINRLTIKSRFDGLVHCNCV